MMSTERLTAANAAATAASLDDDDAELGQANAAARAAYNRQCHAMYVTAILEADPDLAF